MFTTTHKKGIVIMTVIMILMMGKETEPWRNSETNPKSSGLNGGFSPFHPRVYGLHDQLCCLSLVYREELLPRFTEAGMDVQS